MDFVAQYKPSGDEEVFDIMNVLEPLMQQSNSAVALGAIRLFLQFSIDMPATHQQVRLYLSLSLSFLYWLTVFSFYSAEKAKTN